MILQCSECQSRYLVPDQSIGVDGRTVRCANCKHTWFQELTKEAAKDELERLLSAASERAIEPRPNLKPTPIPPGSNLPVIQHYALPLSLKAGIAAAGMMAIALAILLFSPGLLGLPSSEGLKIADPGMVKLVQDNKTIYTINGKIVNTTSAPESVPSVRITLMDDRGVAVQSPLNIHFSEGTLQPGKSVAFTSDNIAITPDTKATRFVVDMGSRLELALRRKPD